MDNDYNDLIIKKVQFSSIEEVREYGIKFLANLCDNDIVTFRVY